MSKRPHNKAQVKEANSEGLLLLVGLEASVAELGGGVDELEVDLLQCAARGAGVQALAESEHALVYSDGAALEHEVVVLHQAVVGEATERVDALLRQIVSRGGVVGDLLAVLLVLKRKGDESRMLINKARDKRSPCRHGRSSC